MSMLFRIFLFISLAFLVLFGWLLIFLGFGIIPIAIVFPFIDYRIAISGFFIWLIVLLVFFLEQRLFFSSDGIDIQGSIRITRSAIIDLIRAIEIDGLDELTCKVSIRNRVVELKINATCFSPFIEGVAEDINKKIDEAMKELLITDYKKMVYINHIKKKRRLM